MNLLRRLIIKILVPTQAELLPKDLLPAPHKNTLRVAFAEDRLLRKFHIDQSRRTG